MGQHRYSVSLLLKTKETRHILHILGGSAVSIHDYGPGAINRCARTHTRTHGASTNRAPVFSISVCAAGSSHSPSLPHANNKHSRPLGFRRGVQGDGHVGARSFEKGGEGIQGIHDRTRPNF